MMLSVERIGKEFSTSVVDSAILRAVRTLGYDSPTKDQSDAIKSFLGGTDVFVCLPTGSGKSLCYAVLTLLFDILRGSVGEKSIVVVVSPLSSLKYTMK